MIWTYINITENPSILGYHPSTMVPCVQKLRSLTFNFWSLYLHKIWNHHAGSLSSIPWDFCLKKKNPKCPRQGGALFFPACGGHHGRDDPNAPNMWSCEQRREEDQVFVGAVISCWELLLTQSVPFFCVKNIRKFQSSTFAKTMWDKSPSRPHEKTSHLLHFTSSFLSAGGRRTGTWIRKKKAINKRPQVMLAKDRCPTSNFQGRLQLAVSLGSTSIFQPKPCSAMGSYQRFIGRMSLEGYVYKLCHLEATIPTGKDHLPATIFEGQAISFNFNVLAGRSQSSNFFYHL